MTLNLEEAINLIKSSTWISHHLSCAADVGHADNSALCIHYKLRNDTRVYSVAIPGLNYVEK